MCDIPYPEHMMDGHIGTEHPDVYPYAVCEWCGDEYRGYLMKIHMALSHPGSRKECHFCPYVTFWHADAIHHFYVVHPEQAFVWLRGRPGVDEL